MIEIQIPTTRGEALRMMADWADRLTVLTTEAVGRGDMAEAARYRARREEIVAGLLAAVRQGGAS